MNVLFDLNLLIDVACRWQRFPESLTLYRQIIASPTDHGALAACGYTTLYYIINQILSDARTRAVLAQFCTELAMIPFTAEVAATAQRLQMADLEDACIAASAFAGGCDVIASRNVGDFHASPIMATPRPRSSRCCSRKANMSRVAPPRKPCNQEVRSRQYLTATEVTRLAEAAQALGRHGHRDACMILLAFRHGLRVSELIALRWDMVDLDACLLHVTRLKHGVASSHPLRGPAVRGLRRVKRDAPQSPYVFVSEREAPMTDSNFRKMLARAGRAAGFDFLVHPHMLRHATGYKLANDGQDTRALQHYLGHKNIQHTVRYTALNSKRFNGFWNDQRRAPGGTR